MWRARSSSLKWEKRHGHCFLTRGQKAKKKNREKTKIVEIGISLRVDEFVVRSFSNFKWPPEKKVRKEKILRTDTIWDQIITAPNKNKKPEKVFLLDGDQFLKFRSLPFHSLRNLKNFEWMLPEMMDRRHGNDALLRETLWCRVLFCIYLFRLKIPSNEIQKIQNPVRIGGEIKSTNTQTNKQNTDCFFFPKKYIESLCLVAKKCFDFQKRNRESMTFDEFSSSLKRDTARMIQNLCASISIGGRGTSDGNLALSSNP